MMLVRRLTVWPLLVIMLLVTGCGRSLSSDAAAGRIAQADERAADATTQDDGAGDGGGGGGGESGGAGGAGPASGGGQDGGAAGAPFGPSGRRAAGAPVNIPAFTIAGAAFDENRQFVTDEIVAACGDGTQCVGIAVAVEDATSDGEPGNDGYEPCAVLEGTPAQTVERGGTITFRVAAPCGDDGSPVPEGSAAEPADREQADPSSGGTDDGADIHEQTDPGTSGTGADADDEGQAAGASEGGADVDG